MGGGRGVTNLKQNFTSLCWNVKIEFKQCPHHEYKLSQHSLYLPEEAIMGTNGNRAHAFFFLYFGEFFYLQVTVNAMERKKHSDMREWSLKVLHISLITLPVSKKQAVKYNKWSFISIKKKGEWTHNCVLKNTCVFVYISAYQAIRFITKVNLTWFGSLRYIDHEWIRLYILKWEQFKYELDWYHL